MKKSHNVPLNSFPTDLNTGGSGSGDLIENPDSSGLEGSGAPDPLLDCEESSCGYGGNCIELPNGMSYCSCSMNCSATRKPVCGSDLVTYGSDCIMREAACEQQIVINTVSFASCEGELKKAYNP